MNGASKVKSFLTSFKKYWKTPPEGRYMPYKEIFSLSVGGMGVKFTVYCISQMVITVGNTLIGNTIGIDPSAIYVIYIISILAGFPLTAVRARMIDNTRSMKGKYRPYILTMGIPSVLLGIGFIWMPYERMSLFIKCAVVLAYNIGFQFFYNFLTDAYDSIINVLSPNTIERSDVLSIKSVVENFTPSIAGIFLPIAARLITGENTLYDIKIYRALFPPMLIIGFLISMLVYVNTEEKIIRAKTHVIQIKFTDAFRAVAKNKYFWIISLAGWLGFLESSFNAIIGWLYSYQNACSPAQYAIIVAISGNASFWPNLVAPFFVRKFGKRKILVVTNLLNILFIALMLPVIKLTGSPFIIWALLLFTFINTFISALGHLLGFSINADIRDYQQYITGERIDGMFSAVALIGSIITLGTSSVLPAIYEKAGLNREVALSLGYDGSNVYDVLYNTDYFIQICSVLILASVAGAVLNVIPFFFYDLTEIKQKAMVRVLKIRVMFEDFGNGVITDEKLVEAVDIINNAEKYFGKEKRTVSKEKIKAAKKTKDKEKIKKAKEEYKKIIEENEEIEIAGVIADELKRFGTPGGADEIRYAKEIAAAGMNSYFNITLPTKKEAKKLPKTTQQEKDYRRNTLSLIEKMKTAKKAAAKYFPDGIREFDSSVFEGLFKAEDSAEMRIHLKLRELKNAKEQKDNITARRIRDELKEIQREKKEIQAKIKKATDENTVYYRATKPYLDAKKLLLQQENYTHLEEIRGVYLEAKERLKKAAAAVSVD